MSRDHDDDLAVRWSAELDRLELELRWTERLLKVAEPLDPSGWTPHEPRGPIPTHLVPRAQEIARQQAELQLRLVAALRRLNREQRYTAAPVDPEQPRFIDIAG